MIIFRFSLIFCIFAAKTWTIVHKRSRCRKNSCIVAHARLQKFDLVCLKYCGLCGYKITFFCEIQIEFLSDIMMEAPTVWNIYLRTFQCEGLWRGPQVETDLGIIWFCCEFLWTLRKYGSVEVFWGSDDWGAVVEALVWRDRVAAMVAEVDVGTVLLPIRLTLVQLRELQSRCNCNRVHLHQTVVSHKAKRFFFCFFFNLGRFSVSCSLTTLQGDRHAYKRKARNARTTTAPHGKLVSTARKKYARTCIASPSIVSRVKKNLVISQNRRLMFAFTLLKYKRKYLQVYEWKRKGSVRFAKTNIRFAYLRHEKRTHEKDRAAQWKAFHSGSTLLRHIV